MKQQSVSWYNGFFFDHANLEPRSPTAGLKRSAFSSPEAAILLVSTENHDLWPGPTPKVRDSRISRYSAHSLSQVWQIWLVLVSIYCVYKAIQNRNVVGPGQRFARGRDFQCWPKGSRPLGTRMIWLLFVGVFLHRERVCRDTADRMSVSMVVSWDRWLFLNTVDTQPLS